MLKAERRSETMATYTSVLRLAAWSLLPLLVAGCARRAHEESRVRSVEARIDGITCPTCVPPLTASLRRQFDKAVAIDVDDVRDTATVRLDPQQEFSAVAFRQAVERVRMRVVDLRLDACGRMEAKGNERWLTAGSSRFLVHGDRDLPLNQPLCITGRLDASHEPFMLDVTTFELQHP
jgi:hypothetical protein